MANACRRSFGLKRWAREKLRRDEAAFGEVFSMVPKRPSSSRKKIFGIPIFRLRD
jgi:hypothetical protein